MRYRIESKNSKVVLAFTPEGVSDGEELQELERHLNAAKPKPRFKSYQHLGTSGEFFLLLATSNEHADTKRT